MANDKITNKPSIVTLSLNDIFHVVDVSDNTDDPAGSSKKATISQILALITAAQDFDALSDTPANKTGSGTYFVKVNAGETALEYVDPSTINISSFNNDSGFLTSFTEADPIFTAHPAFNVTNGGGGTNFLADDGTYKPATVVGATEFFGLTDTPSNYTASANYFVRVKAAEDGLEFVDGGNINVSTFINDAGYINSETDPVFTASPAANVINSGAGNLYLNDAGTYTDPSLTDNDGIYTGSGSVESATATISTLLRFNGAGDFQVDVNGDIDISSNSNLNLTSTTVFINATSNMFIDAIADINIAALNDLDLTANSDVEITATTGRIDFESFDTIIAEVNQVEQLQLYRPLNLGNLSSGIGFYQQNASSSKTFFAGIEGFSEDITASDEDGRLISYVSIAGTKTQVSSINKVGLKIGTGFASNEKIEVDGAIIIGNANGNTNGTIRYTGTDIEGRIGGAWVSLSGGGTTNLSITNQTATTLDIASDTGTDATIPSATTSLAGLLLAADKTKIDSVETGATKNNFRLNLTPRQAYYPSTSFATPGVRNNHNVINFDSSTNESCYFDGYLKDYKGGGLTIEILWVADTSTTGSVKWDVSFERLIESSQDIDSDGFAAIQTATESTNGTSGVMTKTTITFTDGSQIDDLSNDEFFRINVSRDAVSDVMTGDAQLRSLTIKETGT